MQVRVLGAHQSESSETRLFSMLVDGCLAVDAGSLASTLSLAEQCDLADVLITHHHLDHIKDLGILGLNLIQKRQVTIHATALCRDKIAERLLSSEIWLDFFKGPVPESPVYVYHQVVDGACFVIGDYEIRPVPISHHTVPVTGYEIRRAGGGRLFYTGDTGPGLADVWPSIRPDVLVVETTLHDAMVELATRVGHLTPRGLEHELTELRRIHGYLPRVVVVHVNPYSEELIRREISGVASRLQCDITVAHEGYTFDL